MSFLTEGMLAAKAVRSSLSGPLEATKSRGVTRAASPVRAFCVLVERRLPP